MFLSLDYSSVFLRNVHCDPATGTNTSSYYTIMHICNLRRLFIFCIISLKLTPAATASEPQNIFGCFRSSLFNDSHTSSTSIPCTSDFNFSFAQSVMFILFSPFFYPDCKTDFDYNYARSSNGTNSRISNPLADGHIRNLGI